jgi:hypothetical protein
MSGTVPGFMIPILQKVKLIPANLKWLAQGDMAPKWLSWGTIPCLSDFITFDTSLLLRNSSL